MAPRTAPDAERTSILLEAMCSAADHYIIPAFYDVVLTRKYAHDDQSGPILDILFANRVIDIPYTMNMGKIRTGIKNPLVGTTDGIASTLASITPAVQAAYEKALNGIRDAQAAE